MSPRRPYATDLSDDEWKILKPLVPEAKPGGRPRAHETRELLNAIFYVLRGGCAWRLLPHDFLPWQTAYHYFRARRMDGTWERIHTVLSQRLRGLAGREPTPSRDHRLSDGQDYREGGVRGYDGAKKISGRKRHLLVDSTGLVSAVVVHEGNIADRDGAKLLLGKAAAKLPRMEKVWADRGCNGKIGEWMKERLGWSLEIVKPPRRWVWVPPGEEPPPYPREFIVLPRRWVIERTFAWILRNRRMSRDYEFLAETAEALIYVAMIRLMVSRLAKGVV
jgi:putative transposase